MSDLRQIFVPTNVRLSGDFNKGDIVETSETGTPRFNRENKEDNIDYLFPTNILNEIKTQPSICRPPPTIQRPKPQTQITRTSSCGQLVPAPTFDAIRRLETIRTSCGQIRPELLFPSQDQVESKIKTRVLSQTLAITQDADSVLEGGEVPDLLVHASYGSTNDASSGTVSWTDLENAEGEPDETYATASLSGSIDEETQYFVAKNFVYNVDPGKTIVGIQLLIYIGTNGTAGTKKVIDINPIKAGILLGPVVVSGSPTDYAPTDVADGVMFGDESELWGTTWSPSDVNDVDFGFAFRVKDETGESCNLIIDSVQCWLWTTD